MYAERPPYPSRPYGDAVNAVAELDADALIQRMGKAARQAAAVLARTTTAVNAEALRAAARAIRAGEAARHTSNASAMARREPTDLTAAVPHRRTLTPPRTDAP